MVIHVNKNGVSLLKLDNIEGVEKFSFQGLTRFYLKMS